MTATTVFKSREPGGLRQTLGSRCDWRGVLLDGTPESKWHHGFIEALQYARLHWRSEQRDGDVMATVETAQSTGKVLYAGVFSGKNRMISETAMPPNTPAA